MSLNLQFLTMLSMIGCGIYIGMAVDTFYRFHSRKKRAVFYQYANEILFWCLQGLITFYLLFLVNRGEIRFYIIVAILFGFLFYQRLLREWYKKALEKVIQWMVSTAKWLKKLFYHLIWVPLKAIFQFLTYILTLFWTAVIAIILFIREIISRPFLFILKIIGKMIPQNVKKYLLSFTRFYSKIKEKVKYGWTKLFSKRR